jgi:hypothetical protein
LIDRPPRLVAEERKLVRFSYDVLVPEVAQGADNAGLEETVLLRRRIKTMVLERSV